MSFSGIEFGSKGKERCLEISCNKGNGIGCPSCISIEHRFMMMIMCGHLRAFSNQRVLHQHKQGGKCQAVATANKLNPHKHIDLESTSMAKICAS